ncbi:uncharacterized protein B0P05DRAFT_467409, partial [Gilbertella persicaria]|uniref:uncharacterized protein n=1 Tax=Gilbertella persicaria TaxID=101096 RepID=UPI00221F1479
SRLEAIRNEFQNLNQILLNRPDANDPVSGHISPKPKTPSLLELEATGQLIHHIQQGWDTIHNTNQENFKKAQKADRLSRQLLGISELHHHACDQISHVSSDIQEMHHHLDALQSSAVTLMHTLSQLEEKIDAMSIEHEMQQFELWKQEQEQQLEAEIALKRQALREKENTLRQQYEEYDHIQQKKRLELYEANFNAELEDYRQRRETKVSSLYSNYQTSTTVPTTTLEQLKLEDHQDLSDFLEDEDVIEQKTQHRDVSSDDDEEDGRIEILADEDYQDV